MIPSLLDEYKKNPPRTRGEISIYRAASVDISKDIEDDLAMPKRMTNEELFRYYGNKLDKIWLSLQDDKIKSYPIERRRAILEIMKGNGDKAVEMMRRGK